MATKLKEMVEAEAQRAEADPEEDEVEGSEPEPEPEPEDETEDIGDEPRGVNPELFEEELKRHEAAMAEAIGSGWADMSVCGHCGGVGFAAADFKPLPELRPDPSLVICGECNGYGQRSTPSLDERYMLIPCTTCSGTGYRDGAAVAAMEQAQAYSQPQPVNVVPPQPVFNQATGQWETPDGQPLYMGSTVTATSPA